MGRVPVPRELDLSTSASVRKLQKACTCRRGEKSISFDCHFSGVEGFCWGCKTPLCIESERATLSLNSCSISEQSSRSGKISSNHSQKKCFASKIKPSVGLSHFGLGRNDKSHK